MLDRTAAHQHHRHVSTVPATNSHAGLTAAGAITAGAVVSLALGLYGRAHQPTGQSIALFGFGNMIEMKVWLAVAVGVLALLQLVLALWMYGKLGIAAPARLGLVHRAVGIVALLVSLPVAYHCLWSLGFGSYDTRVLAHSLLGCLVYGAFVTKILGVQLTSAPSWLLPWVGGLLFTILIATVLTSAGWYLATTGLPSTTPY
jgi:hypothetical protein